MEKCNIITLLTALLLLGYVLVAAQECDRLRSAVPDQLVSYLDGIAPDENNADCITFAIRRLGEQHYEPAIARLTKLLDFRRPLDAREKQGLYVHMQTVGEIYPAASALVEIGVNSLPSVMEAIKGDPTSPKARENAVFVWMGIHRYESPNGVALLKREADQTNDAKIKPRLTWAVSQALTWCGPADRAKCRATAKTGYPD